MDERRIVRAGKLRPDLDALRNQLERSREALAEAEAELAKEQAAVNAFRMHCRLQLDDLVDRLSELRSEKEGLLVQIEFHRQGIDLAHLDRKNPLFDEDWKEDPIEEEGLLLPTDTPRDKAAEKRLFRELARRFHPDLANSAFERSYRTTIMAAINEAYASRDSEALYDFAGELMPEEAETLARISDSEQRKIIEAITKMQRLRNKARRQLATLREENTARLWRRAESLEAHDQDGWSVIRRELEQAIDRRASDVASLRRQLANLVVQE